MDAARALDDATAGAVDRLPAVVDIGANPIDGDAPYAPMLRAGRCTVVGFEPQDAAREQLLARAGALETYLPYAVGDGEQHTLRIARASGMTSLLEPDRNRLALFNGFTEWGAVTAEQSVETRRLDDIVEVEAMDLLKIDVQGAELLVFEGAASRLDDAVAVQTEVSFVNLYRGQPSFGDVDRDLRSRGFVPHTFAAVKRWAIAPTIFAGDARVPGNQLLEADVVYVRDFGRLDDLADQRVAYLALIAHHVFRSVDLAYRCLLLLARRRVCTTDAPDRYLSLT